MRLTFVLILLCGLCHGQSLINSYNFGAPSTLSNGLQARLDFNGNTTDAQGNTVTQPEGTAVSFEASLNGQAATFTGSQALEFTDADLETEPYSVSIVFKTGATGFQILSELSRQVTTNHKGVNIFDGATAPVYMMVDDTNYQGIVNTSDGAWYHVIVTYDGTNYAAYVDDSATASISGTDASNGLTGNGKVYIGGRPDNSSEFLTGAIDMVAWWDRALTAAEIAEEFSNYDSTND